MEMILHHHHTQPFGTDSTTAQWPSEPVLRLPSLFRHTTDSTTTTISSNNSNERSPRLVGMSDVLNATRAASADSPVARLPSIGAMIRRDESTTTTTATHTVSAQDANSMSPAQKQCMDLYKQLREVPSSPPIANAQDCALSNLLANAALSQLATMQHERKEAAAKSAARPFVPSSSSSDAGSDCSNDKTKRATSAKLCGMTECRKRAKAGGFCIAHGGGLRCSEDDCQKHAVSLGLCISHGGGKRCTIDGCLNASRKNGVCWSHGGKRLCKLDGCNKGPKSGGYCWSHGGKMKK